MNMSHGLDALYGVLLDGLMGIRDVDGGARCTTINAVSAGRAYCNEMGRHCIAMQTSTRDRTARCYGRIAYSSEL